VGSRGIWPRTMAALSGPGIVEPAGRQRGVTGLFHHLDLTPRRVDRTMVEIPHRKGSSSVHS
jgi:hypothetical protein